jgi:hypothetical protein
MAAHARAVTKIKLKSFVFIDKDLGDMMHHSTRYFEKFLSNHIITFPAIRVRDSVAPTYSGKPDKGLIDN